MIVNDKGITMIGRIVNKEGNLWRTMRTLR